MNNLMPQQPQPAQDQPNQLGAQPQLPAGFDLDDAIQHNEAMADTLSNLLAKPDLSSRDILQALVDSANRKSVSFQQAAQMATQMPPDDQLKPWLANIFQQNIQIGKALQMHKGNANGNR